MASPNELNLSRSWEGEFYNVSSQQVRSMKSSIYALLFSLPCFITIYLFSFCIQGIYVFSGHSMNPQQEKVGTSVIPLPIAGLNKSDWDNGRLGNFA